MDSAKHKIRTTVESYKLEYPAEYQLLREALVMRRKMLKDGIDGTKGSDMTPMYELSETLQMLLSIALEPDELTWWKTREGGRWFIRTYPIFSLQ